MSEELNPLRLEASKEFYRRITDNLRERLKEADFMKRFNLSGSCVDSIVDGWQARIARSEVVSSSDHGPPQKELSFDFHDFKAHNPSSEVGFLVKREHDELKGFPYNHEERGSQSILSPPSFSRGSLYPSGVREFPSASSLNFPSAFDEPPKKMVQGQQPTLSKLMDDDMKEGFEDQMPFNSGLPSSLANPGAEKGDSLLEREQDEEGALTKEDDRLVEDQLKEEEDEQEKWASVSNQLIGYYMGEVVRKKDKFVMHLRHCIATVQYGDGKKKEYALENVKGEFQWP
jgi:hypothetical protein